MVLAYFAMRGVCQGLFCFCCLAFFGFFFFYLLHILERQGYLCLKLGAAFPPCAAPGEMQSSFPDTATALSFAFPPRGEIKVLSDL